MGKSVPEYLLHTICLELDVKDNCVSGTEVRSIHKLPRLVSLNDDWDIKIYPMDDAFNAKEWTYINRDRFTYVGNNKWLQHIVYFTVFNEYLYVKSASPGFEYLKKVMVRGFFESQEELFKKDSDGNYIYQCENTGINECQDPLDLLVGLEDFMIPSLLESVIRDLTPDIYRPVDLKNNANDNLSGIQTGNPDRGYNAQNPVSVNSYGQPGQLRQEEQYE
jgi:hypothetical protein